MWVLITISPFLFIISYFHASVQMKIDTVCLAYIFEESILTLYLKERFIPMSIFIISFLNLETTSIFSLHMQNQRGTWVSCSKPEYTSTAARSCSVHTIFDLSVSPLTIKNSISFVGEEVCHQMLTIGGLASWRLSFDSETVRIARQAT